MLFFLRPYRRRRLLRRLLSLHCRLLPLLGMAAPPPEQEPPPQDPPFDPSTPSTPISYPIKDLQALESRSYFDSFHYPFNRASIPLPSESLLLPSRPRLLVCHDMQGGYVDDKWVQGGRNPDAYAIWHWYLMDVFVYFSHSLVTLPPPCWTNAAHTHGVKVLGTFLTEWDEGRLMCNTLQSTEKSARMYAERLTELASTLGFDGWLINMEVKLDLEKISILKEFVAHLTQTMHSTVPGSLVIWYDSVTKDGDLDWQDQLNEKNKVFFDLCDGIFVNYTWKENYPKLSADIAGDRRFDVYMGIDVFGRNTYGGGQWNTNVALDLLKSDDVSAAIFAPGWVYETKQEPDFQTAQNRWWGLVEKSWGILQKYPTVLPFYTNFDQGRGLHFSIKGLEVTENPWNNISCQGFQPVLDYCLDTTQSTMEVFFNSVDASYCGGGNITCRGTLQGSVPFSTRLFEGQLPFGDLPVHISYSVKSDENTIMGLSLGFSSKTNDKTSILIANDADCSIVKCDKVVTPHIKTDKGKYPVEVPWVVYETTITMTGYTLTEIYIFCCMKNSGPSIPGVEVPSADNGVKMTNIHSYCASLGHISLHISLHNMEFPTADSWTVETQYASSTSSPNGIKSLSLRISWRLKTGFTLAFSNYNIFVEKLAEHVHADASVSVASADYIGTARAELFYVSDLQVPSGVVGLKFIVQACGFDGMCQELDKSPICILVV